MNKCAIIVAGGSGTRMEAAVPKQFILLYGKPLLMWSLKAFATADENIHIILVLPENHINTWKQLCAEHGFAIAHDVCAGGSNRFESVKNGLEHVKDDTLVAIHDGARPLVSTHMIREGYATAEEKGSAVPAIPSSDSIRKINNDSSESVDRRLFRMGQTPQCFRAKIIKAAYRQAYRETFTDDASVAEAAGNKIALIEGSRENIKVTFPSDLVMAEALLKNQPE